MMKNEENTLFNIFFVLRKNIFLFFYVLSAIALGILAIIFLGFLNKYEPTLQIFFSIIFTIAATVGGALLSVILDLPKVTTNFDNIKNDVANRKIKDPKEFAERLVSLLCGYFKFSFLFIKYSFVKVIDTDYVYSNSIIRNIIKRSDFVLMTQESQKTVNVIYMKNYKIDGVKLHLYLIPIWFGEDWLGYIGVFTKGKLYKIFKSFLADFEDDYVDDQLVHVLGYKKQMLQKKFLRKVDSFSNKITKHEYTNLKDYQEDVLTFLVKELDCEGGLFITIYSADCVAYFKDKKFDSSKIEHYFRSCPPQGKPQIISDPNITFEFVFEIPILIDKLQGIICLFDNNNKNLKYFKDAFLDIENLKLDNDLENLAQLLGLTPIENAFLPH